MESDIRFYRRRANEELAAAGRAVTAAARDRRMRLANVFLERLNDVQLVDSFAADDRLPTDTSRIAAVASAFEWADEAAV